MVWARAVAADVAVARRLRALLERLRLDRRLESGVDATEAAGAEPEEARAGEDEEGRHEPAPECGGHGDSQAAAPERALGVC